MAKYRVLGWAELDEDQRRRWTAIRSCSPCLASPYFDLGFCDAVARVRRDLRVLAVEEGGEWRAFLPFHPGAFRVGRPVGGPMSDWHGFIAAPGAVVDLQAAMNAMGVRSFRFHNVPEADRSFAPHAGKHAISHIIDLSKGFSDYEASRRQQLKRACKPIRRLADRAWRVELDSPDSGVLHELLRLKSLQFSETRQFDIFSLRWSRDLLVHLHQRPAGAVRGLLSALWIDDRLAAAHFGVTDGRTLHYWFPVYDKTFSDLKPGLFLLCELARGASELGISRIDLGEGDYRYKHELANAGAPLSAGVVHASAMSHRLRSFTRLAERSAAKPIRVATELSGRAIRRFDRIRAFKEGERFPVHARPLSLGASV